MPMQRSSLSKCTWNTCQHNIVCMMFKSHHLCNLASILAEAEEFLASNTTQYMVSGYGAMTPRSIDPGHANGSPNTLSVLYVTVNEIECNYLKAGPVNSTYKMLW